LAFGRADLLEMARLALAPLWLAARGFRLARVLTSEAVVETPCSPTRPRRLD
jgi:hypothetical protein